jgi:hypothetical protein
VGFHVGSGKSWSILSKLQGLTALAFLSGILFCTMEKPMRLSEFLSGALSGRVSGLSVCREVFHFWDAVVLGAVELISLRSNHALIFDFLSQIVCRL